MSPNTILEDKTCTMWRGLRARREREREHFFPGLERRERIRVAYLKQSNFHHEGIPSNLNVLSGHEGGHLGQPADALWSLHRGLGTRILELVGEISASKQTQSS